MFRCIVGVALGIGIAAIIPWAVSSTADPKANAAPKAPPVKVIQDDRSEIADKLFERTDFEGLNEVAFKDVVKFLEDRFKVTIIVDAPPMVGAGAEQVALNLNPEVMDRLIKLPSMKKIRGSTMLQMVLDQVGLTYLIYPDHIRLVSWEAAAIYTEQSDPNDPNSLDTMLPRIRSMPLVNMNIIEKSLPETVKEIERRTGRTVAIAAHLGDKVKANITIEFSNVPLEKALDSLAEMAGLQLARKGNMYLITSSERAEKFDDRKQIDPRMFQQPFNFAGFGGGQLGVGGFAGGGGNPLVVPKGLWQYPEVEDLNKKIAEVEKQLKELQQKK